METGGEGSVGELTLAVHFTAELMILREIEARDGGGGRAVIGGLLKVILKSRNVF